MPYVKQSVRHVLDSAIDDVLNCLRELECDNASNNMEGNINYVITRILHRVYPGTSYREINDAVGLMESCKMEYYRKRAAKLEDQKEFENGSVD